MLLVFKRLVQLVLILLLLAIAGVTGIVIFFDPNAYKADIESEASRVLGREVQIAGEISLTRSLVPGLTVRDVSVADAPWTGNEIFAQFGEVDIAVALVPLISRDIVVERLSVRDARFSLTRARSGALNLPVPQPGRPAGTQADRATATTMVMQVASLSARAPAAEPMTLDLEGTLEDVPLTLAAETAPLNEILGDPTAPFAVDASVTFGQLAGAINGTLQAPAPGGPPGADLVFDLTAPDITILDTDFVLKAREMLGVAEGFLEMQGRRVLQDFLRDGRLVGSVQLDRSGAGTVSFGDTGVTAFGLRLGLTGDVGLRRDPTAPPPGLAPGAIDARIRLHSDDLSTFNALLQNPLLAVGIQAALGGGLPLDTLPPAALTIDATLVKAERAPLHPAALRLPDVEARISLAGAEITASGGLVSGEPITLALTVDIPDPLALSAALAEADLLPAGLAALPATPLTARATLAQDLDQVLSLSHIDATVASGPANVRITGGLADLAGALRVDLTLAGEVPDWTGALAPLAAVGLAPASLPVTFGPTAIGGRLEGTASTLSLSELVVTATPAEGSAVALTGRIDQLTSAPVADLALAIDAPGLDVFAPTLPALGPVDIDAALSGSAEVLTARFSPLSLGPVIADGDVTVRLGDARPRLTADMVFAALDFADLEAAGGDIGRTPAGETPARDTEGAATARSGRLIPATPLATTGLDAVDAALRFSLPQLTAGALVLEDVTASVTLEDRDLTLGPLSGTVDGRPVSLSASLDARRSPPTASLRMSGTGLDAGNLLRRFGIFDHARGSVDIDLALSGAGDSVAAVAANAQGRISLVGGRGEVDTDSLDTLTGGALRTLLPGQAGQRTVVHCLALDLPVQGGLATAEIMLFDSPIWTLTGDGTIDLATEALDLTVEHTPTGDTLALPVAVRIAGTLANPQPGPQLSRQLTDSLLAGALSNGERPAQHLPESLGDTANVRACHEALARRDARAGGLGIPGFTVPTEAVQEASDVIEERVQETREAIESGDPQRIQESLQETIERAPAPLRNLVPGLPGFGQ